MVLLAVSCSLLTATAPPEVEVQSVALRGVGLFDQELAVGLCVSNPNDTFMKFGGVTVGVDAEGMPLAEGVSETAMLLPPRASTLVPFQVVITARNLAPQLLGVLKSGEVDYSIHGTVQLTGAFALSLPFSHRGRLGLMTASQDALTYAATPEKTRCRPASA